jgi:hypothetical protein
MKIRVLSLLFILFSTQCLMAGGPWTQPKNEGIVIGNISPVIYRTYSSSGSGGLGMWRRVTQVSNQAYFELGLTDQLMLLGNLSLVYAGTSPKTFQTTDFNTLLAPGRVFGMGNSSIGMKYRFTKKSFLFAMSFQVEFPGSTEKSINGLRTGYDAWTFLPGIHMGQGFSNGIYYFVEGSFGGHTRLSDEYRLQGEFGYHFKKPLILAVTVHVKQSLKNKTPSDSPNYQQTGLYLNDQEYISWAFKFTQELSDKFGWNTALAGGFHTELIARTPVISFGMYYKWKAKPYVAPSE